MSGPGRSSGTWEEGDRRRPLAPILLRGGRVIDPMNGRDEVADVLIQGGEITAVGPGLGIPDGAEVIQVTDKVVTPGLIDLHVHLREPGGEASETVATGARAAAAGGFTSVCAMPNTDPVTDNAAAVGFMLKQAAAAGAARVYPIGCVSMGMGGLQLSNFGAMTEAGAVAVSDDGRPVKSSHLMRTALEYAQTFDIPVADHCEDLGLAEGGSMNEGLMAMRLGLKGIPTSAESIMVARDIILAELTGGHVHLCHMSCETSVSLIRWGKDRGINVTAEVTPHHLTLTDAECDGYNTNAKMNPPLQSARDVAAVRDGLKDGTLDVIASDHAPHHQESKERDFDDAPFGIIGLETALALGITELVASGLLTLPELIDRMSARPARIFHLEGGSLSVGSPADVTVLDASRRWTVDRSTLWSKSANTPYMGRKLTGRVEMTFVGGRRVYEAV